MSTDPTKPSSPLQRALAALLLVSAPCIVIVLWSPTPALSCVFWWSLVAAPAGVLACRVEWRMALLLPGAWFALALVAQLAGAPLFPWPWALAASLSALFGVGLACGRLLTRGARARWALAGVVWMWVGLLGALPAGGGSLERPWSPRVSAALLDLSPQVWVFESAGYDWMRHAAVYERAGAADLGPDLRVPWGARSTYFALVVGLLAAAAALGLLENRDESRP